MKKTPYILPAAILLVHAALSLHAAKRLSPTWDEIAYPAAGVAQLKTGQLNLNTVNPFLSKLFYAVPVLFTGAQLPLEHPSWKSADEYRFGFAFTYRNVVPGPRLVFLGRVPVVLFSVLTAALLYLWISSFCGPAGGLVSLLAYVTTPALLSRASVAQLEMPMYFFILAALAAHHRWFTTNDRRWLAAAGALTGLGALCKLVVLPLIPTFALLNLFFHPAKPAMPRRLLSVALVFAVAAAVVALGYLPWNGGWAAAEKMALNLVTFDKILPFYWHGKTYAEITSLVSWPAFFIKSPLHVLLLSAAGWYAWRSADRSSAARLHLSLFLLACLGSVLFFKNAVSTIQLSPAYLAMAGLAGGVALGWRKGWAGKAAVGVVLALGAADVYAVHPNYLGYFNRTAGGTDNGFWWLADSDQDWGQSLPALSSYLAREGEPGVVLCYSGSGDPEAYGIRYQDLLSPALVTRERRDQPYDDEARPRFLAVGTKVIQSEPAFFTWLTDNLTPKAVVGGSFLIYDVSQSADAFGWMSEIYRVTGRPEHARKARLWASQIKPTMEKPT